MDTFVWKGRLGPIELTLSRHTFRPSTISQLIAKVLEIDRDDTVIDVGSGSGILAIIAAKLGAGRVYATDVAPDAVDVGTGNARRHGVADRIMFAVGSLFDPIPAHVRADVIIGDVSGIPDALARESGWFPSGVGGGPTGSELPIRMLKEAVARLRPAGRLLLPTGTLQDESAILATARSLFASIRNLTERIIPLPEELAGAEAVRRLLVDGVINLGRGGSRHVWTARVWECKAPA